MEGPCGSRERPAVGAFTYICVAVDKFPGLSEPVPWSTGDTMPPPPPSWLCRLMTLHGKDPAGRALGQLALCGAVHPASALGKWSKERGPWDTQTGGWVGAARGRDAGQGA